MKMKRLPNHEIGTLIAKLYPFTNYNNTIEGFFDGNDYVIKHWDTEMFRLDCENKRIKHFEIDHISQTSSVLVGRILRNVRIEFVAEYIQSNWTKHELKTVKKYKKFLESNGFHLTS